MPTDVQPRPMPFRRKRVVWVCLIAIVAAGAGWIYLSVNPPWRVRVYVTNIPVGTDFMSLVADAGGALHNMEWSPNSELSIPITMHPGQCVWSSQNPDSPKVDWHAYVRWRSGDRYGVLTRSRGGVWRVHWFEADAVPLRGQRWLLGGGEASFDVAAGQTVLIPAEQLKHLGLDQAAGLD